MNKKSKIISRKFLWCLLAIVLLAIVARLYFRITDDFRLANMTYELPYHKEWEIPQLNSQEQALLDSVLAQNFYYIGKGAQSLSFFQAKITNGFLNFSNSSI